MAVTTPDTLALSIVDCAGTPRERGRAHGEEVRPLIQEGLGRWLTALGTTHRCDPEAYLRGFLTNTGYLAAIERWTPALLDEVRGIAEGAGLPFAHVLAYNLLDEEWTYAQARHLASPGCTVTGFRLPGTGIPIIAQTMDIPSVHDGTQTVLRLRSPDGREALVFTFAGMIGLNGCNEAGVGVVVNNLAMLASSPQGLPVAFVVRGILERSTLEEASAFVRNVPHATGQHYAIGSPQGLASFECSASGVVPAPMVGDRVLHTNHPLVSSDMVGDPEPAYTRSRTRQRYAYICQCTPTLTSQAAVEDALADTSVPVSLARGDGFMTFGAVSMELTAPPRMRVAPGPPHCMPYVEVGFSRAVA